MEQFPHHTQTGTGVICRCLYKHKRIYMKKYATILAACLLIAALALVLMGCNGRKPTGETVPAALPTEDAAEETTKPAEDDELPMVTVAPPEADESAEAATEPGPTETKPVEPAPTEPAETQPAETQPAETQPDETQPAEAQPERDDDELPLVPA